MSISRLKELCGFEAELLVIMEADKLHGIDGALFECRVARETAVW
jgi:hypothetical protein